MLKITTTLAIILMAVLCSEGSILKFPSGQIILQDHRILRLENESPGHNEPPAWQTHVMDFIHLVDIDSVLSTVVRFIDDPEVMRFIGFLLSPKFKDMVWEFERLEEFKEAYIFLATKGYDIKEVIDYVNKIFNLPQFDEPHRVLRQVGYDAGVSGFIAAIVGKLPLQEMKNLLKTKVEYYPDVAEFIAVIKSPEFVDIMQRLLRNQKFGEFKSTFESYGVDFNFICVIINEINGDVYENGICGNKHEIYL